jgi:hypothetical protein
MHARTTCQAVRRLILCLPNSRRGRHSLATLREGEDWVRSPGRVWAVKRCSRFRTALVPTRMKLQPDRQAGRGMEPCGLEEGRLGVKPRAGRILRATSDLRWHDTVDADGVGQSIRCRCVEIGQRETRGSITTELRADQREQPWELRWRQHLAIGWQPVRDRSDTEDDLSNRALGTVAIRS